MNRARLGQEAFPAREDYLGFIELLMDASEMFNMRVAAYCLLSNHHLLIEPVPGIHQDPIQPVSSFLTRFFPGPIV